MGLAAAAVSIAIKAALDLSSKLASEPITRWLNALAAAANLLAPNIPWVLPLSLFVAGCAQASQGRFKAAWARVGLSLPIKVARSLQRLLRQQCVTSQSRTCSQCCA